MEEYYEDDFEDEEPTPPPTPDSVPPQDAAAAVTPIAVPASEPVDASACSRSPTDMRFPWQLVSLEELDLSQRLAAGAMGAVHAGTFRGRPVAVKTLHDASSAALAAVEAELLVHASIKHERIVELCGANLFPPGCCIVMERCECSLFEKLHRRADELTRRQSMDIARQVAEGMRHLHSRRPPIVHRDLKSHNVLLDVRGDAKLCDFGLVGTKEVTAGTPNYMAPELFLAKPFSTSVDVFAFGVLLNELWAREVPWDGYQPLDIRHKVIAGERPPTPRTMPYSCETLLKRLWHATPASRPTFDDALHSLDAVIDALPTGHSVGRAPIDSLDSLDSLAGLSLMPQQRGTRGW